MHSTNNIIESCPICRQASERIYEKLQNYKEGATSDVYFCKNCDSQYVRPLAVDSEIYNDIYRSASSLPGYGRYSIYAKQVLEEEYPHEYLSKVEDTYDFVVRELKGIELGKDSRILEVGSGLGYLTYSLNRAGYNVVGIDISSKSVEEAESRFGNIYECIDLVDFLDIEGNCGSYDIVILTEVIEHVPAPDKLLKLVAEAVSEHGKILLTTPNRSRYAPDLVWHTELPPVHLWWFSETGIKTIAEKNNLYVNFYNFKDRNRSGGSGRGGKDTWRLARGERAVLRHDGAPSSNSLGYCWRMAYRCVALVKRVMAFFRIGARYAVRGWLQPNYPIVLEDESRSRSLGAILRKKQMIMTKHED